VGIRLPEILYLSSTPYNGNKCTHDFSGAGTSNGEWTFQRWCEYILPPRIIAEISWKTQSANSEQMNTCDHQRNKKTKGEEERKETPSITKTERNKLKQRTEDHHWDALLYSESTSHTLSWSLLYQTRAIMASALSGPCNILTDAYVSRHTNISNLLACNMLHVINRPRTRAAPGMVNIIYALNFQTESNALGRGGGTLGLPLHPCHHVFRALLPERKFTLE
jgi:hypothetical protein